MTVNIRQLENEPHDFVILAKAGIQDFIKICQNTPQLSWGKEWPTLSLGACLREAASAKAGERVRVRGK